MTRSQLMQTNDNMNTNWQTANCQTGYDVTRTEICSPPLYSSFEAFQGDARYPPPAPLSQQYPSTNAYRQPPELAPCRWCGGSRPTERCLTASCGRMVPERREKEQLFQTNTRPFSDLSLVRNPRCSACLTGGDVVQYRPRDLGRYSGPCVSLKTSQEPVNTPIYQQSITIRDFTSPGTNPPWTRTKGNRRSFYDRFMVDMCRMCVLKDTIPDHGSLGGEISQYQADFDRRQARKLKNLYSLPDHASHCEVSAAASAFATCHKFCNF